MATIYTREKNGIAYYCINYVDADKKRRRKVVGKVKELTKKQVNAIRAHYEAGLLGDASPKVKRDKTHFCTFLEHYLADYKITKAPNTFERVASIYRIHLTPFFGDFLLSEITLQKTSDYINKRYADIVKTTGAFTESNKETINKELRQLKALLYKAVDWEILPFNPIAKLKPLKVEELEKETFTESELKAIYKNATYPHWAQMLVNTGMRLGELVNLKWSDIEADKIKIKNTGKRKRSADIIEIDVSATNRTKSGKNRIIPINKGVTKALKTFKKLRQENDIYLMPRMAPKSYIRALKRDIVRAGLNGSAHNYRHTFCTMLARKGMDVKTIQKLAGHSKLTVTEGYLHDDIDNMLNKVNLDI